MAYNDPLVRLTFVVPESIKRRLRDYARYHAISMTDVLMFLVSELSVDPHTTMPKEIETAALKTGLFLGQGKQDSPVHIIKGEGEHKNISFWKKMHLS